MKKILIVDDSRVSRKMNSKILVELGHEIVGEAVDGLDGLQKLKELDVDLIVTDIEMPNLDGIGMVQKIRDEGNNISVVVASTIVNNHLLQEVIRLKAGVVKKPIKKKLLANAIEMV